MLVNGLKYKDGEVVCKPFLTDFPGKDLWLESGLRFAQRIKNNANNSFMKIFSSVLHCSDNLIYVNHCFANECFKFVCNLFDDEDLDGIDDQDDFQYYDAFLLKHAKVLVKLQYQPFESSIKFYDVLFIIYFVIYKQQYTLAKFMIYDLVISCFTSKIMSMNLKHSCVELELMLKFFIKEKHFFQSEDVQQLFGDKFSNLQRYYIKPIEDIISSHKLADKMFIFNDSLQLLSDISINFMILSNILKNNVDNMSIVTSKEDYQRSVDAYGLKENFNSIFFFLSTFGLCDLAELQGISDECFFRICNFLKDSINLAASDFSLKFSLLLKCITPINSSSEPINQNVKKDLLNLCGLIDKAKSKIDIFINNIENTHSIVNLEQKQKQLLTDFMVYFRKSAKFLVESFVRGYVLDCMNEYEGDAYEDVNFFIRAVLPSVRDSSAFSTDFTNDRIINRILDKLRGLNILINSNIKSIKKDLLDLLNDMTRQLGISVDLRISSYETEQVPCEKYFERLSFTFCMAYCRAAPARLLESVDAESIMQPKIVEIEL